MNGQELEGKLQTKLKQLGGRFVERTILELGLMQTYLQQGQANDAQAAHQLLLAAHRINGSGAMLGFAAISECARGIEILLRTEPFPADAWQQIEQQLRRLDLAVQEAQRTISLSLANDGSA